MKKLVYLVVFLLIAIAFTPWIMGLYFKEQFQNLILAMNQEGRVKIEILEYHTGWLSSDIKLNAVAQPAKIAAKDIAPIKIVLNEKIIHGPVIYDRDKQSFILATAKIDSYLHLPPEMENFLFNHKPTQGVLHFTSIATFDNHWLNHVSIPAINLQLPQGNLSWQGLNGHSDITIINNQISSVQSQFEIGLLSAQGNQPPLQLNVQPISLSYNGLLHPVGLWVGSFKMSVPNVKFKNPEGNDINLENFNISTKNDVIANKLYNANEQITLQKLEIPSQPIPLISPANLMLAAYNFNAQGVIDLANFMKKSESTDISNTDFRKQLLFLLTKTVTPTTVIQSDASFTTPMGSFLLNGKASGFPVNANSIDDILQNSQIQANVRIAIPLAKKLLETYFQALLIKNTPPDSNNPATVTQVTPINQTTTQQNVEAFNEKVAGLMREGKITLPISIQVMTLSNQNLTLDQFAAGLDKFNLPADIKSELTQTYSQLLSQQQVQTVQTELPTSTSDQAIAEWINKGYLVQDQNDYVISITRDASGLKVNGKPFSAS